ncbi:MAG: TonB-dependent receptor, partial [Marinifilum sp.]|nr:TonB-dependent receptor [Marinifilum sp.]
MEKIHDVRFSYEPKLIQNKKLKLNPHATALADVLKQVEDSLHITCKKIDERYYILASVYENMLLKGYVIDKIGGTPINGANIINLRTGKGTVSMQNGSFSIENNHKGDSISISFLGYDILVVNTDTLPANRNTSFFLAPINFALDEIVVKEYLGSGVSRNRNGNMKFTPRNLDILSGLSEPDILQNIQLLPGIESPLETASGLHIRGGTPSQNLILWDGIKMYNSSHFFGMISAFNPYIIKDVLVSRSGTHPQYGDRVSGVVDITTENKIPDKVKGQAGVNMIHGDAHLKIPLSKNVGLIISGRRSFSEIFQSPTFNKFSKKTFQNTSISNPQKQFNLQYIDVDKNFSFSDFTLKTIVSPTKNDKLTFSSLITQNTLDNEFKVEEFDGASIDQLSIGNYGIASSWERKWNKDFTSHLRLYYSQYDFSYNGQNFFLDSKTKKRNNIKEKGLLLHTNWRISNSLSLFNGYQFFSNNVSYSFISENQVLTQEFGENLKNSTHTFLNQFEYKKHNRWKIGLGLRSSYYTALNSFYLEPRISLEHSVSKTLWLKTSAELKNQAINQLLDFTTQNFGLETQVWTLAAKNLIPLLNSEQLSFGFLFSKQGWDIDLDIYFKHTGGFTTFT